MPMFRPSARRIAFCIATTFLSAALVAMPAAAQPVEGERRQSRPDGPPAAALAACKSLERGQTCAFNGQRGKVIGTCEAREGKALACRPQNAPDRPQSGGSPKQL